MLEKRPRRVGDLVRRRMEETSPLRPLSGREWAAMDPTWRDAKPGIIAAALQRAHARPSGNWYVAARSADVRAGTPSGITIAGVELVLWRSPPTAPCSPGPAPAPTSVRTSRRRPSRAAS